MGADVIGWRHCPLQQELGGEGFLGKLKLRSYCRAVEAQLPEEKWPTAKLTVRVTGREPRDLTYPEMMDEVKDFERGIPECADCPLSGGKPLGCYRYVTYPVDEAFERSMFEFFTSQVETKDAICQQLYADLIAGLPPEAGWYEPRVGPGTLAELPAPLEYAWQDADGVDHNIDSAQVLLICFITLDEPPLVAAYGRFWSEYVEFIHAKTAGVKLGEDGGIEVTVQADGDSSTEQLAKDAIEPLALLQSRTIEEVRHVADMLVQTGVRAVDPGWLVLADG